jgi:osmoprotectant transport system substrate-binding protein
VRRRTISSSVRSRLRRFSLSALVCAVAIVLTSCFGGDSGPAPNPTGDRRAIRVASYDYTENQVLAELYSQALQRAGLPVEVLTGLGTREIVAPALEQGHVDFVVDYLGASLNWVLPGTDLAHGDPKAVHALLQTEYASRGVDVLPYALAEDRNGFAVRGTFARQRQVSKISDLAPIAHSLVFAGPPECPSRRFCLLGLEEVYGLKFREVRLLERRSDTAAALMDGEIDVGMLETTDPRLSGTQLVLLQDDRGLQPQENIVPLVRREVMQRDGERISKAIEPVTAGLTTAQLIELNRDVDIEGFSPAEAARIWLDRHGA